MYGLGIGETAMTNHQKTLMEPVRQFVITDSDGSRIDRRVFATHEGATMGAQIASSGTTLAAQVTPVLVVDARWLTREEHRKCYGNDNDITQPCWFVAKDKTWFGSYWRGLFEGMDLVTGQRIVLPYTSEHITHVKPIPTPEAPEV